MTTVRIRFDGPPGATAPHFVDIEGADGQSIRLGRWVEDTKGNTAALHSSRVLRKDDWFLEFEVVKPF